jgi:hypothetical protein
MSVRTTSNAVDGALCAPPILKLRYVEQRRHVTASVISVLQALALSAAVVEADILTSLCRQYGEQVRFVAEVDVAGKYATRAAFQFS